MKSLPSSSRQIFNIWHRNYLQFKRAWTVSLFWILIEPTIILGAIGYGVGSYINTVNGLSYIEFFFPALLCTTSMMVAFFESTYGNFSKLTYQKIYHTLILSPLSPREIVAGEILWGASKGTLSSVGVALVGLPLGLIDTWRIFPVFVVIFISSLVFSSLGMVVTSIVKNYDSIIYPTSGLVVPMSLLSGTYFAIDQLPVVLKYFVYLLPLTHSVALSRSLLIKGFDWFQIYHIAFLIGAFYLLFNLANRRIEKKLIL